MAWRKQKIRESVGKDLGYRSLSVRAETFKQDERTVEAVISTETPVDMPDWQRMEMVPEVLIASGVRIPGSQQVPLLDSHQRASVKDQIGSVRNIRVEGNQVVGVLHFSRSELGEQTLNDVRDGHITDVSVGYETIEPVHVARGEKQKIAGREFSGPVNVAPSWRLRETSVTPIGADEQAKLRGLDPTAIHFRTQSTEKEPSKMNEQLRKLCESRGMSADLSDDQAQEWLARNADKLSEQKPEKKTEERGSLSADDIADLIAKGTARAIEDQQKARAAFEKEVASLCELADLKDEAATCRGLADLDAVKEHLNAEKKRREVEIPYSSPARVKSTGLDSLKKDIRSAITLKACRTAVNGDVSKLDKYLPADQRSESAETFRHASIYQMAEEFVRTGMGIQTLGLTREQVAKCAMFGPDVAGIRNARGASIHGTGSFANLTLDAVNKSMMIGYDEVPATWRGPMRQGESTNDFKTIHRMQLGAIPNLPVWNDSVRPELASMGDSKESYAVECRSIGIDFGYKLLVNDDMSALSSTPNKLGDAAARTVNAVAWSQITSNPTMRDGKTLFSAVSGARKQANLTTGSVTDYTAALNTMYQKMNLMRGENTPEGNEAERPLGLTPQYIAFPAALRGTLLQLIRSQNDPKAGVANITNINTDLVPVIEPLLDSDSSTAFYTFAGNRIETVEVTFLAGQETPQVRTVMDEHTLTTTYYVLQSVAAKALEHRGIQKHSGA